MRFILIALVLVSSAAFAESISLPNISKNATGSSIGGGRYALDVSLPSGNLRVVVAPNAGASFQEDASVTSTPETFTTPADTIEILCQAPSSNTANVRMKQGSAASSSSGTVMEPGRSEVLRSSVNVSYAAESGTQAFSCQFSEQN